MDAGRFVNTGMLTGRDLINFRTQTSISTEYSKLRPFTPRQIAFDMNRRFTLNDRFIFLVHKRYGVLLVFDLEIRRAPFDGDSDIFNAHIFTEKRSNLRGRVS